MEKFYNLPIEKQTKIINAALKTFGENGYKKTSVNDIALEAGISKAMVFHYFGTKKALYLYLIKYCSDLIMTNINGKFDMNVTDFFDRIIQASEIKIEVISKHPDSLAFLKSVYFETNEEVADDFKAFLKEAEGLRSGFVFDGLDTSKFKDGIDIKLVLNMLVWMSEGLMSNMKGLAQLDIDYLRQQLYESMNLLKNNLYKEEYL